MVKRSYIIILINLTLTIFNKFTYNYKFTQVSNKFTSIVIVKQIKKAVDGAVNFWFFRNDFLKN